MNTRASLPIKYRDFYDIPRAIAFEFRGTTYLLDCPFDDEADEYGDSYGMYRLSSVQFEGLDEMDWRDLTNDGVIIGELPAGKVELDETRRQRIFVDSLGGLLSD